MRRIIHRATLALVLASACTGTASATEQLHVPAVTIYPGDIIRDGMLTEHDFNDGLTAAGFLGRKSDLVGKVAKRTLLPGQAVAAGSVGLPKLVTIGAMVRLVYEEGDLKITAYASALQAGAAGDLVSVRNIESGVTLSGVVAPDGTVHVSNG